MNRHCDVQVSFFPGPPPCNQTSTPFLGEQCSLFRAFSFSFALQSWDFCLDSTNEKKVKNINENTVIFVFWFVKKRHRSRTMLLFSIYKKWSPKCAKLCTIISSLSQKLDLNTIKLNGDPNVNNLLPTSDALMEIIHYAWNMKILH